ncbi:MAG TPA: alpha/beta fold hydrolase [Gaiellaceae bacterium]|nr:alpha/beta fold hydrolase [Gaiellaceae bacterium]
MTSRHSRLVGQWGKQRRARRPPLPRWFWPGLAVVLLGVGLGVAAWTRGGSHPWRPPSGAPRFVSCTDGGYVHGWCGNVAVPEDPLRPAGRTISLRVAVLPATTQPAAGALFYLEGGPGGAATASAIRVNQLFAEVGRDRDLVMVDQRGTGGSHALSCADEPVRASDAAAVAAYVRRCFARLRDDPRLYTTSVAADDLEAVRRTLGYGRIDLYGGSYGATLAQVYLRRHPDSVRSAVLDGASLPGVRIYELSARNAERALDAQLARCAAAPACRHAFPHPRRELSELLARPPRRVTVQAGTYTLSADDVAWTVAALSAAAEGAALIPYTIDAAAHGDYKPLARAYAEQIGPDLDPRARLAMSWEILCSESWARFDPAATARAGAGSYLADAAVARAQLFRRACRAVPRGRVPADAAAPAVTRAPVLLLAGGADPLDPAGNLRGWRRVFPNGRLVIVPGAGHGAIAYGCVPTLVARFVARGSAGGLDTACAARAPLPPFLVS